MRRTGFLVFISLLLLATLMAAGCAGQARGVIPLSDNPGDEGLPLRVSWVRILMEQGREDIWRPMQYAPPTVADNVVYLGNTENVFYAFDEITGDTLWKFNTNGPVESGATLLGADAVVIGDGDGYVYCLNRRTGFAKWVYRVQGQVMGRIVTDGELVFIRTTHERVYALRAADGKWKWMQSREVPVNFTIRGVATPVLDGDRLLVGYADGYFIGYNKTDGTEIFKTLLEKGERFLDIDATPIIDGANLYVASYSGTFYCLSRENASIQWTFRQGSVQSAAVAGERVFLGDDQGFVHALNKRTGELYWSYDLRESDQKRSIAKSPRRRLKAPTNPVPFNGLILVASSSGYIYALDQAVGQEKWEYWPGFGVTTEIVTHGNSIFIHTNFGNLYCLKPNYRFNAKN